MIKINNLSHSFGDISVLRNFSLDIDEGIYALMGKSGSGKTTLIRLISGMESIQSGSINVDSPISVSFQENRLFPWYSALKNVEIVSDKRTARKILSELNLDDSLNKYPSELSGGMKRRVSLARSLAAKSKTILLDEPFSGLDNETAQNTLNIIRKYSHGKTVLISTHNNVIAEQLDKIIYINPLN